MMVIMKFRIKLLWNLVGRQGYVLFLSGTVTLSWSYGEAVVGPDSDKWLEAMKSEMGSMYENKVWTLEVLPEG